MIQKCLKDICYTSKIFANKKGLVHLNIHFFHHCEERIEEEKPPFDWYERGYSSLLKLAHVLRNVDQIDGRLININNNSTVMDDFIDWKMQEFKHLAREFLGAPSMQQSLKKQASSSTTHYIPDFLFSKQRERKSMTIKSLTQVGEFLNVSAQQRKTMRLAITPQVTQQHILRGTLKELMTHLNFEIGSSNCLNGELQMGKQIVSTCIKFLADDSDCSDPNSPSWMRLAATKKPDYSQPSRKWGDVMEMFKDLACCLKHEKHLAPYVSKLDGMNEGLSHIKDVLLDRDIGYRQARRHECLVQKKLSQSLGHSSECLFTLLIYYLCGSVRNIEVEVCGGVYKSGDKLCLCIGKFLTSSDERMVWSGVKQMGRALGLLKFVWETTGMGGVLELQGHLWVVGAEERIVKYRGNVFFIHQIKF